MKATHEGTCQVCGCLQKLPNGKLSLHGYTRTWGFFNGTCYGSRELPFERSKDLIEGAIARTQADADKIRKESEALKAGKLIGGENEAWYHVYVSSNSRYVKPGYQWQHVTLTAEEQTTDSNYKYFAFSYTTKDGKTQRLHLYGDESKSLEAARLYFNTNYAKHLDKEVSERERYIRWQQERIKDWKPTDLKEIKK